MVLMMATVDNACVMHIEMLTMLNCAKNNKKCIGVNRTQNTGKKVNAIYFKMHCITDMETDIIFTMSERGRMSCFLFLFLKLLIETCAK